MPKSEISVIQKQIEEDDGVPGARVRKNAQRAEDANPTKTPAPRPAVVKPEESKDWFTAPLADVAKDNE